MIKTEALVAGIGDIEGTIEANIGFEPAVVVLQREWQRLRTEGMGGVYLTVRDSPCPFEGLGSVLFNGTYQLLLALENALVLVGLQEDVLFEFRPLLPAEPQRMGWEEVEVLCAACHSADVAREIERALQSSSRPPYGNLLAQTPSLKELRENGKATLFMHTRNRKRLERLMPERGFEVSFVGRLLSTDEVLARRLNIEIHHIG